MFSLPVYSELNSLEWLVQQWSAEPFYAFTRFNEFTAFYSHIHQHKPPLVVITVEQQTLQRNVIGILRTSLSDPFYNPFIVAVTQSSEDPLIVGALNQGADRAHSIDTLSESIFQTLIKSILPGNKQFASSYPPYHFDTERHRVSINGDSVYLRNRPFSVAHFLFANHGVSLSKEALLKELWGVSGTKLETRRVETQVSIVRSRLQLDGRHGWQMRFSRALGYGIYSSGDLSPGQAKSFG